MQDIDQKIENALHDKNIVKIMNKAASRFHRQLCKDTIYTCQLNALWKAMLNFKPEKNVKFTTYLFHGVFIECLKEVKFIQKHSRFTGHKLHDNISNHYNPYILIDILDEAKTPEEKEILLDKFANLTINEMANKRNSNRETTRKKMKNIFQRIQKNIKEVY